MALSIDEIPIEIARLRGALEALFGNHRNLRHQFEVAALAADAVALKAIRARLEVADSQIEAVYAPFRDEIQRFGAEVCAAVRSLQDEEN